MSVNIRIQNAVKKYGDNVVIPDLSLDIKEGEFFTLLGPSGCGKTTLLRMIAGFNSIEGGDFYFGDRRINDLDPSKRNIGMVFQNYAIFPNMTVEKNVEFGLKNRNVSKEDRAVEVKKFLKLMQIEDFAERMPEKLSGGQQQRVALARALVIKPDVLLMDEPLSNLDAKLRIEMRTAIKQLQNSIGITTVYVTHDQEEAMAVSDRIAVFNHGVIQQIGTPKALYQRPANLFVANFIGHSNELEGSLTKENGQMVVSVCDDYSFVLNNVKEEHCQDGVLPVKLAVRPEEWIIQEETEAGMEGTIIDSIFLGLNTHYLIQLSNGKEVEAVKESEIDSILPKGKNVKLQIKSHKVNVFLEGGSENILQGVL
ncbi:iron(III) transport system ATP-binding protein [Oribacterium sinus]|uniref:Iron(III) transport system ATP-binding protein n=1 Tax=Oribacterium sinus TaxID=237576 RepID=A0A7W9W1A2_9FIRM|nr:ABC transporter ATP-binding protein [Oribacterium sinus]MBB6040640.1 iron(III) transport system ATP-binding protein [Oribacterium sinus]